MGVDGSGIHTKDGKTMSDKIYLSGPVENPSDPGRWRKDIKESTTYATLEFLDPYTEEEKEPKEYVLDTYSLLSEADAVLVHYEPGVETYRVPMEMRYASESGKPVVVWTDRYDGFTEDLDPFLQHFADEFQRFGQDSVNRLMKLI